MNGSVLIQSLKQLWGIIVLEYKYCGNLPSIESYHSQVKYALPFSGEWVVANGGVTEKNSHSWEIPTQRYAPAAVFGEKRQKQAPFIVMAGIF